MTTAKEKPGQQLAAASSKPLPAAQPIALPACVSETRKADGFRNEVWAARDLLPGEDVPVKQALVALSARTVPAGADLVLWHIGRLLSHWDNGKTNAAAQDQQLADWEEDLAQFSEAHIAEACGIWRRTQKFKPHIADIVELIERAQIRDKESARRCRVLLKLEAPRHWERIAPAAQRLMDRPTTSLMASITRKLTAPAARRQLGTPQPRESILASRDPKAVARLASMKNTENKA